MDKRTKAALDRRQVLQRDADALKDLLWQRDRLRTPVAALSPGASSGNLAAAITAVREVVSQ